MWRHDGQTPRFFIRQYRRLCPGPSSSLPPGRNRTKTVTIWARSGLAADRNNPICFQAPQKCVVNFKMAVALMAHVINKLRFLSDFKATIMQEKNIKNHFLTYTVALKKLTSWRSLESGLLFWKRCYALCHCIDHIKSYTCCLPLQTYADNQQVNCFFWVQDFDLFIFK